MIFELGPVNHTTTKYGEILKVIWKATDMVMQGFLTWGPRIPKGSVDTFQGFRELGWGKNYIFIFTNL
jgi:hypothetical protein